jgi:cytochrome P450
VFGPDPDTFRPERWLDSDTERIALMDSYYMPVSLPSQLLTIACEDPSRARLAEVLSVPQRAYPFYLLEHTSLIRRVLQFGMGPRACQGKNVALMVLSKVIPQLVRTYDFELDEQLKDKEWKTLNYWIVKQLDFKCRLKLRGAGKAVKE